MNRLHRVVRQLASSRVGATLLAPVMGPLDRAVMRRTGGRSVSGLMSGQHVALVTTTGARSGQPREVPLLAIADGAALVLVASSWGREHNPAWYVNLVADRHVTVSIAGSTRAYVARTAAADERTRLWALADATYAGYRAYRSRARREIPLVVLEPT